MDGLEQLERIRREYRLLKADDRTDAVIVDIGQRLTDILIPPEIESAIQVFAALAAKRGHALRLLVPISDETFHWVPWEWLRIRRRTPEEPLDGVICLQPNVWFVRTFGEPREQLWELPSQLRALTIVANPGTARYPRLGWLNSESNAISASFGRYTGERRHRKVLDAVPALVHRAIEEHRPHIFHFSGHCERKPSGSYLVLQGAEPNTEILLPVAQLAEWLKGCGTMLVVIHGCDSAGARQAAAEVLFASGIPAVVGMQGKAIDAAMPQIARTLYGALLDGADVDAALAELRGALPGSLVSSLAPVLYVSGPPIKVVKGGWDDRSGHPDTLPQFDGEFVGRAGWLSKIAKAFQQGRRVVSVVGAGGIGKSRLAVQAARSLLGRYPDGVWFVQCDTITDAEGLYFAIATVLGLPGTGGSVREAVVKHLRDRQLLLVLDCFEAAVAAGLASIVTNVLDETSASCLITSRSPLEIDREEIIRLDALELPAEPGGMCESVSLFLQGAGLDPASTSKSDLRLMGQICDVLQGMPLAVRLAGWQHRVIGLRELLKLLEQSPLRTLEGEVSPLSLAIQRSLNLVAPKERYLLWQLCVFVGSFTWDDLEAVVSGEPHEHIHGLTSISRQGLVQVDRVAGGKRYRILDTVREYLSSTVQSEEQALERAEARSRHATHFVARAVETNASGKVDELWAMIANFRAALAFSASQNSFRQVALLCDSLARSYGEAGLYRDFDDLANKGLVAFRALGDEKGEIALLGLRGAIAARRGDEAACRLNWRKRAELCEEAGDHVGAADSYIDLSVQYRRDRDFDESERLLNLAEEHLELEPKDELLGTVQVLRATLAVEQGRFEEARTRGELAEQHAARATDQDPLLFVFLNLGRTWAGCGDSERAEAAYLRVMRQGVESKRYSQAAIASMELSATYEQSGLLETSYLTLVSAVKILDQIGSRRLHEPQERLAQFQQRHSEACELFHSEWKDVPWLEMIEEVMRRAQTARHG